MFYFIVLLTAILLSWSSWIYVLFAVNPDQSGLIGFFLFYLSLFLSLSGTFTFLGFFLRRRFVPDGLPWQQIKLSFRQGLFLSFFFNFGLYLASQNMLRWWNSLLLIVVIMVFEGIFQVKEKPRQNIKYPISNTQFPNNDRPEQNKN